MSMQTYSEDFDGQNTDLNAEAPTAEAPTAEAPTAEAPTAEAPTAEAPTDTVEAPAAEAPAAEAPAAEAPAAEAPAAEAPAAEAPTAEAPTAEAPTAEAPTAEAPTVEEKFFTPKHRGDLKGILPEVIAARGYYSEVSGAAVVGLGFADTRATRNGVPTLVMPVHNAIGEVPFVQIRPDHPRYTSEGKVIKYETQKGAKMVVDVNPVVRNQIIDPATRLVITEGMKKADCAISHGLCCVALLGVWNWRGTNSADSTTILGDWEYFSFKHKDGTPREVWVAFDSDVMCKDGVKAALKRFVSWLQFRGAKVTVIYFPEGENGEKVGLDDYLNAGNTVEDLERLAAQSEASSNAAPEPKPLTSAEIRAAFKEGALAIAEPCGLADVKAAFRSYLYIEDESVVEVILGTLAANLMDGDPVWLMLIGASSGGKTEFINPLRHLPFSKVAGTITEAALLSGTSKRDQSALATGGLLAEIGNFGILLAKDFTSVLSMNGETSTRLLAALREIYDGSWTRRVGTDGGLELTWHGKLAVIACCTEIIDDRARVVGAMGERFVYFRLPKMSRSAMARRAITGSGNEDEMREGLKQAVAGFFAGLDVLAEPVALSEREIDCLAALADLASRCRSGVLRDSQSRGITMTLESEYPGRIAKIMRRVFSGLVNIGVERPRAWFLVTKMAFDSMHKTRRQVFGLMLQKRDQGATTKEIGGSLFLPDSTVRRTLEDLTAHGIIERDQMFNPGGKGGGHHCWQLAPDTRELLEEIFFKADWNSSFKECFPEPDLKVSAAPKGAYSSGHRRPLFETGPASKEETDSGEMDGTDGEYGDEFGLDNGDEYVEEGEFVVPPSEDGPIIPDVDASDTNLDDFLSQN